MTGDDSLSAQPLSSANHTGAGLGNSARPKFELGVEFDSSRLQRAPEVIAAWPSRSVDSNYLDQLIADSACLTRATEQVQEVDLDSSSAFQLAEALLADARDPD